MQLWCSLQLSLATEFTRLRSGGVQGKSYAALIRSGSSRVAPLARDAPHFRLGGDLPRCEVFRDLALPRPAAIRDDDLNRLRATIDAASQIVAVGSDPVPRRYNSILWRSLVPQRRN